MLRGQSTGRIKLRARIDINPLSIDIKADAGHVRESRSLTVVETGNEEIGRDGTLETIVVDLLG